MESVEASDIPAPQFSFFFHSHATFIPSQLFYLLIVVLEHFQ